MGIEKSTPIAMILPNQQEVAAFTIALAECGFRKIVAFTSTKEAYEVAVRQQFQLFVTRMDMPIWNGIIVHYFEICFQRREKMTVHIAAY